jgi:hypothetical protein
VYYVAWALSTTRPTDRWALGLCVYYTGIEHGRDTLAGRLGSRILTGAAGELWQAPCQGPMMAWLPANPQATGHNLLQFKGLGGPRVAAETPAANVGLTGSLAPKPGEASHASQSGTDPVPNNDDACCDARPLGRQERPQIER